jgi:anthranilate phosphoribosyltransferase
MSALASLIKYVVEEHGTLSQEQGYSAVREMLEGEATDVEIAAPRLKSCQALCKRCAR